MKITDIQKNRTNRRISVYIEGDFAFSLSADLVAEYGLQVGKEISPQKKAEIEQAAICEKALQSVLNLLNYGLKSKSDLEKRLHQKKYPQYAIDYAMQKCLDYGMVNDLETARAFVRVRKEKYGWGPSKIRTGLYQKGIPKDLIEQVMDEMLSEDEAAKAALKAARKKVPSLLKKVETAEQFRQLMYRFLAQRGFRSDTIGQVIEQLDITLDEDKEWPN